MFRDPWCLKPSANRYYQCVATHPFVRIWHAGCSTGEEVYSMAIMLEEANLLHKSLLYATDLNPTVIENINRGIFPLSQMKQYSENYIASGGKKDFSHYYTAKYDWAKFDDRFRTKMVVATHNLASDRSFNEFRSSFTATCLYTSTKCFRTKYSPCSINSLEKLGYLILAQKKACGSLALPW